MPRGGQCNGCAAHFQGLLPLSQRHSAPERGQVLCLMEVGLVSKYSPRIVDSALALRLEAFGAVMLIGPKWCGKTTTGTQQANSVLWMQDPDRMEGYLATAEIKPSLLLKGENPRLIDEWQVAPVLWDAVRTAVDRRQEEGLFLLTTSTAVDNSKILHTGTGRISRLRMYPMSLYESQESNGRISLNALLDHPEMDIDGISSCLSIGDLACAICRGGWPAALQQKGDAAKLHVVREYLNSICESEISAVYDVQRRPSLAKEILHSYALCASAPAKKTDIRNDLLSRVGTLTLPMMNAYLRALEKLFVIEDIDAWCPAIRPAAAIRAGKKRSFTDPSIAAAVLEMSPWDLLHNGAAFSRLFECLCIRDLKVYSQAPYGRLSYYQDRYGLKADAVLHLGDGRYALINCRLGDQQIEDGAKQLLQIKDRIAEHNHHEPQAPLRKPDLLMVISGGDMAYTRKDGIKVVPIGTLRD